MTRNALVERLTKICRRLPETQVEDRGAHASFLVRKKVFAYFLDDHPGDGIVAIAAKALPGDNTMLVASDPARFYLPAYIGTYGWVGLRLDVGKPDWEEVEELLLGSYLQTAPKTLTAQLKR